MKKWPEEFSTLVEYPIQMTQTHYDFEVHQPTPANRMLEFLDRTGRGVELDESGIGDLRPVSRWET